MKKGGTIPKRKLPSPESLNENGETKGGGDVVVPPKGHRSTWPDDYHAMPYNYGDKLPQNRGIPIPMSPDESAGPPKKTRNPQSQDKHAYKIKWV